MDSGNFTFVGGSLYLGRQLNVVKRFHKTYQRFYAKGFMPINRKMMASLMSEYGSKKGEDVYYAIENKMKKRKKKKKMEDYNS